MLCLLLAAMVGGAPSASGAEAPQANTLLRSADTRYRPTSHPDRVIVVPGADAAREVAINWRTRRGAQRAELQWTRALDTPGLHLSAATAIGETVALRTRNGTAHHHSVRLGGLAPDTLYAYRVRGEAVWSEWLQFRTAPAEFRPFSFLYFGDAQNSVRSHFSRVIRGSFREHPQVALLLHAGDLVNQRRGNHDDEWGEWFEAGGFLHAMVATVPVAGNHEYLSNDADPTSKPRVLGPHWSRQFSPPRNGPRGFEQTVYYLRYAGVLFVVLDSMRALDEPGAAAQQARWLDELLSRDQSRWVIVSHHHPMFSVALGRDNPTLREHWLPVYERHGVDLVLQGHDHAYGRGHNVAEGTTAQGDPRGPVYVVSVAGPKQYIAAREARAGLQRIGEDLQLYQLIHIEADRLRYQSLTIAGRLYDAFDLERRPDGPNKFVVQPIEDSAESRCANPAMPRPTRCWEGTELTR